MSLALVVHARLAAAIDALSTKWGERSLIELDRAVVLADAILLLDQLEDLAADTGAIPTPTPAVATKPAARSKKA